MATNMADEQPTEAAAPEAEVAPEAAAPEAVAAEEGPQAEAQEEAPASEQAAAPEEQVAAGTEAPPEPEAGQTVESEAPPAEGEAPADSAPAEPAAEGAEGGEGAAQDAAPAEAAEAPPGEEGEQPPEGEPKQAAEGEAAVAEGDEAPAADGEAAVTEDQTAPEGEEQAAAGEPAEDGEAPPVPAEHAAEEKPAEEEAAAAAAEGGNEQREGSPVVVGEQLSREGSPTGEDAPETARLESPPIPGTPDQDKPSVLIGIDEEVEPEHVVRLQGTGSLKEDEEEEMEEEEEMPEFDRDQLIERYHQALAEREQQLQHNYQLQHKLAEHFRKKKSEESRQEVDKNVTDSEQRYVKYMAQLDELRAHDTEEREAYKQQIEELKERCQAKEGLVEDEQSKFMEFQKQVALNALNSRSGKPIQPKDIEQYLAVEARKEAEVVNVRLENIKLKNKLRKKEQQLKSKEELAEGLHLIDFEQLKIENQTYNEKIEERNEDLLKLRKKITSTVQVLTHLKEKLQFVHAENQVLKTKLHEVEDEAAKKRDKLTRTKQARDHLRIDNHRLRHNCGLLGNEPLLRDFEERKDESAELRDRLEELRMLHAELTLSCNGVRKKIEQARMGRV